MPFTSRCSALLASGGQKCGIEAFPAEGFCQEHHNEYLSLKSAYERAMKEAEALEILIMDVGFKALKGVGGSRDPDEARADKIIIEKYIERLQSEIWGRKEVEERFSPVANFGSGERVRSLEAKLSAAQESAEIVGGRPKDGGTWTPTEILQAVTETAAAQPSSEASYSGRDNSGRVARCEARLAHVGVSERCRAYTLPSSRFCAGHREEFKALKEKLGVCTEITAEYRNQVRWGLQHRAGRDPGVELCKFPITDEQLLATVEMYDLFLKEQVELRDSYAWSFLHIPGSGIWQEYWELRKENRRLISECVQRRSKVTVLRLKLMLYQWWLATLICSLLGVDVSENDM